MDITKKSFSSKFFLDGIDYVFDFCVIITAMSYNQLTESGIEVLVRKAQKGNENSFSELFDYFFPKIFRHVSFRVPAENSEDLTSEVFLKVVQNLNKYVSQENAKFSAWLFRIANNTIIDFYRKKKDLLGLDDEEENFFAELPDEDTPPPNEIVNKNFDIQKMYKLLKKLPALQRTILELKFLEDFNNTEIAHITGKTEGNIRIIQLRALRTLRQLWQEEVNN